VGSSQRNEKWNATGIFSRFLERRLRRGCEKVALPEHRLASDIPVRRIRRDFKLLDFSGAENAKRGAVLTLSAAERIHAFAQNARSDLQEAKLLGNALQLSLLNAAVAGDVVPQDDGDEPAQTTLERWRESKSETPTANGSRRSSKKPHALATEDQP
jgi:hypothetical protein